MSIDRLVTSVTLIITGTNFNPDEITSAIGLVPNQSWKQGDKRTSKSGSVHVYSNSGWKIFQDPLLNDKTLEAQLDSWLALLSQKQDTLVHFRRSGLNLELNCYVSGEGGVSFVLNPSLIENLNRLNLTLSFDCFWHSDDETGTK